MDADKTGTKAQRHKVNQGNTVVRSSDFDVVRLRRILARRMEARKKNFTISNKSCSCQACLALLILYCQACLALLNTPTKVGNYSLKRQKELSLEFFSDSVFPWLSFNFMSLCLCAFVPGAFYLCLSAVVMCLVSCSVRFFPDTVRRGKRQPRRRRRRLKPAAAFSAGSRRRQKHRPAPFPSGHRSGCIPAGPG